MQIEQNIKEAIAKYDDVKRGNNIVQSI